MKSLIFIVLLILALPFASAEIIISEVELNPAGNDSGNEWVELFSDSEISLEGYKLFNNDQGEFLLNGTMNNYKVIVFPKQWLDNSDEKVILMSNNNETIDETPLFDDSKNNDLTWSLCNSEWKFMNSTKGNENCAIEEPEVIEEQQETAELPEEEIVIEISKEQATEENTELPEEQEKTEDKNPMDITGQAIKQEENTNKEGNNETKSGIIYESKSEKMKSNAVYIFAMLLLTAIAYLIIKDKA